MRASILIGLLAAAISASASLADGDDDETPRWKAVGNWDVRVDKTLNNGCFIIASYAHGEVLRFGFDRQNANGYMMIGNPLWKSLVAGKTYPLEFAFDSTSGWHADAVAVQYNGAIALGMAFQTPDVMRDFADARLLTITYNAKPVSVLGLKGTRAALAELVQCQNAQDGSAPVSTDADSDPFATPAQ